ncbi:hypothetical protein BW12_01220 [Bifidobacterium sp. UTCIF-3]|nr:hypothetical protein BW09_06635 [Bifidobacterium sp. UTCIF-1]TPF80162.1 hypothetical protein BW08_05855 [Bifidobacterium sp. UTCIF-24]TPF82968.1 hypothetical protein BW12_01220 [Bifidobacterium sp. UTCIF-3]TPF83875.1 hypothetical protein BW07_07605 [Bifidobacterium sp. UTCIF-36]TPF90655.1 hypothetical protein BW10_02960 [Bifidobacterium sp. UTBIF-56]
MAVAWDGGSGGCHGATARGSCMGWRLEAEARGGTRGALAERWRQHKHLRSVMMPAIGSDDSGMIMERLRRDSLDATV